MITAEQMRAARALLRMEQAKLSELSGVSLPTIKRLETTSGTLRAQAVTLASIVGTLEKCGIEFIGDSQRSMAGGVGIRLVRNEDADSWNKKVNEVLSSIPQAVHEADYTDIAAAYVKVVEGKRLVEVEELEAMISEFLSVAEKRLHRQTSADGGLLDLMMPHEDE